MRTSSASALRGTAVPRGTRSPRSDAWEGVGAVSRGRGEEGYLERSQSMRTISWSLRARVCHNVSLARFVRTFMPG